MAPEAPKPDAAPEQTQDDFLTDVDKDLAKIDERFGMESKKEAALKEKVGILNDKIKTLQGKADDTDKDSEKARYTLQIAALQGKLQVVEAQRSQMDVTKEKKEDKVLDRVEAKADKIDAQVKERAVAEAAIKELDGKIAATEGSTDPKVITERAKLLQDRGEAKDKLARLEKKGTRAELEAKAVAYREAEKKERPDELKQNEAATDEALAQVDKPKAAEPDAAPATPAEGGQKSQDFNQRMSGIAFSLAKGLGDNPPDKQNIVGKVVYQGKALLLKITMAFAKHNEWVDDLSETQKTNLQETIGLKFDSNIKGENGQTVINWVPPNPDYNSDSLKVVDFLKSNLKPETIDKIKPDTTLTGLAKETGDEGIAKLVAAMRQTGAGDDVKVLDYIEENLADLKKALKPEEAEKPETDEEGKLKTEIAPNAQARFEEFGFGPSSRIPTVVSIDEDLDRENVDALKVRLSEGLTDDKKLYFDVILKDKSVVTASGATVEELAADLHAVLNPTEAPKPEATKPEEPAKAPTPAPEPAPVVVEAPLPAPAPEPPVKEPTAVVDATPPVSGASALVPPA